MKDGIPVTPPPSVNAENHTDSMVVFRLDYSINNVAMSDSGTYTCTVANPIGSDSEEITLNVVGKCLCMLNCMWYFSLYLFVNFFW